MTNLPRKITRKIATTLVSDEKADLASLLAEAFRPAVSERSLPAEVKVPELTEAHRAALARLPEVFGKVQVTEPRLLTQQEAAALVEERQTIDLLMGVLKKRKDETLRENLANHLDKTAERTGVAGPETPTNDAGHYLVKQDVPVEGTGMKVQGIVSEGKATIDSARLKVLHEEGVLTRAEYLALTKVPEVDRVFDAAKARKAILADPSLLDKIAGATRQPSKTFTVKVAQDK